MEKNQYEIMYNKESSFWWYCGLHELVKFYVKQYFSETSAKTKLTIFDAGCGTGKMIERLNGYGHISGVDNSEEALRFCKKRGFDNIYQADLNSWNGKRNSFDIIYSLDVLCHKSIIDENKIVSEFRNALKDKGLLILNLPAFNFLFREHDKAVHTRKRYTVREVSTMLRFNGFKIVYSTYRLPPLFLILLMKKAMDKFSKETTPSSDSKKIP
jgi:SAM-dependent methyltransferase